MLHKHDFWFQFSLYILIIQIKTHVWYLCTIAINVMFQRPSHLHVGVPSLEDKCWPQTLEFTSVFFV